jgi:hypothetical protein
LLFSSSSIALLVGTILLLGFLFRRFVELSFLRLFKLLAVFEGISLLVGELKGAISATDVKLSSSS